MLLSNFSLFSLKQKIALLLQRATFVFIFYYFEPHPHGVAFFLEPQPQGVAFFLEPHPHGEEIFDIPPFQPYKFFKAIFSLRLSNLLQ